MCAKTIEKPQLSIVRIGAGDAELITLKAIRAIKQAKVIFYDEFTPRKILALASGECKLIALCIKNRTLHAQKEINSKIVFFTQLHGIGVRLRNEDPLMEWYCDEEAAHAYRSGINVQMIPGISRLLATTPIALTKRGVNESFLVITGQINLNELLLAAKSTATVVVKGANQLDKIITLFKEARHADEPAAIIQYATGHYEKTILGDLSNLAKLSKDLSCDSRSVLIIGKLLQEVISEYGLQRMLTPSM